MYRGSADSTVPHDTVKPRARAFQRERRYRASRGNGAAFKERYPGNTATRIRRSQRSATFRERTARRERARVTDISARARVARSRPDPFASSFRKSEGRRRCFFFAPILPVFLSLSLALPLSRVLSLSRSRQAALLCAHIRAPDCSLSFPLASTSYLTPLSQSTDYLHELRNSDTLSFLTHARIHVRQS
jgi:hypothetical protein